MTRDAYAGRRLRSLRAVAAACQDTARGAPMPESVWPELRTLLGFDNAAFQGIDAGAQRVYGYQDAEPDCGPGPDDEAEIFWRHDRSTTCLHRPVPDDVPSILATGDLESLRAWRSCRLYLELCKPNGEEYWLILRLPDGPGRSFRLVCWRGAGRDFGEQEKSDLLLLMPHLDGAYRRAQRSQALAALTNRQRELLELVARGCTNHQIARRLDVAEGTVRAHLNHSYARQGVTSRTAAVTRSLLTTGPEFAR